ncbi:MAG: hypothetical protein AAF891_00110 [Pseudomonadota bacterium]
MFDDNFDRAEHLKDVVDRQRGLSWALLRLLQDELKRDPDLEVAVYALLQANRAQDDQVAAVADEMIAEWRAGLKAATVARSTTSSFMVDIWRKIRMKS